jgi:acyl-CoA dehydrogenase
VRLQALRQQVWGLAAEVDALGEARAPLRTMAWALRCNNLKVAASEGAARVVHQALQVTGIMGYRNDTPYSVGRHYRDVLSASLMVGNERILAKNAAMLLVHKDD